MQGFKSTSANPYSYQQQGVWRKGQYTFQAIVKSDSGYAFAFQRADGTWQTIDLSWQVRANNYCKVQWTFTLEEEATTFKLIANDVIGETLLWQPMLESGSNSSTPIAHEEDLRGMDGDDHEFIFTRNTTGIAPATPLSTQDDDYVPEGWTDNAQGVTSDIPFEFVSMREKKNGVWLDFSPPSLWAKWGEDGLSVNLLVEGHYNSKWEGTTRVTEIIGGVDVGGNEVVKVSAVFRKGETNVAATVAESRGFVWYANGVHLTEFDNQPFITLDETYGDGFADYVVLSYLVNSLREEERAEIINISEGMDGIGEEFIFKAHNDEINPPALPQVTDVGYQNDDYTGDWSDDPVAPTETLQYVWAAKRKKINGEWQAFGVPSVWTRWVEDGDGITSTTIHYAKSSSGTTPPSDWYISIPSPTQGWYLWTRTTTTYKVAATTVTYSVSRWGEDGHSPYINTTTGTWWTWNDATGAFTDTGMKPVGADGAIPYPAGYYDSAATYTRTVDAAPYVQYGETLYLVKDVGSVPAGTLPTNTTYWKAFNQWEAVFITSLVAKFAKIGGAVFTGDTSDVSSSIKGRLISETGVKSGSNNTNYEEYTGDTGSWIPKMMLDFISGAAYFGAKQSMFNSDGSGHIAGGEITWAIGEPTRVRAAIEFLSSIGRIGVIESGIVTSGGQISEDTLETISDLATVYSSTITPQTSWTDSADGSLIGDVAHAYTQPLTVTQDSVIEFFVAFSRTYTGWDETYNIYVEDTTEGVLEYTRTKFTSSIAFAGNNFSAPVRAGTYIIHAEHSGHGGSQLDQIFGVTLKGKDSATNITAIGYKFKTKIGNDGFFSYWGEENFVYYQKNSGFKAKLPAAKWDVPGVLLSATVSSGGGWNAVWGAKAGGTAAQKNSTGRYTVYHTVGHANYQVYASAHSASRSHHIVSKGSSSFIIEWRSIGSSPALIDTTFDVQIVGNNY